MELLIGNRDNISLAILLYTKPKKLGYESEKRAKFRVDLVFLHPLFSFLFSLWLMSNE